MRKLVVILLTGILMAVTNPTMADFKAYTQDRVVENTKQAGHGGIVQAADAIKQLTTFDPVKWYTDQLFSSTRRYDLVILSLYTARLDDQDHIWLGAFKHFWQVK